MTERQVQNALHERLLKQGHRSICPNYTPAAWFECDLFSITKAGYFVEHEVKLSLADFKKDASKKHRSWAASTRTKHERLAGGDRRGPRNFWFVVPEALVEKLEIPKWAGLKTIGQYGNNRIYFKIVKRAPVLHPEPVGSDVQAHVNGVFFWRYWTERKRRR